MRFSNVVFPEPDGPMSARNSPSGTSRLRSFKTSICSLPRTKYLWTLRTWTIGSSVMAISVYVSRSLPGVTSNREQPGCCEQPGCLVAAFLRFLVLNPEERHDHADVGSEEFARLFVVLKFHDLDAHRNGAFGPIGGGHLAEHHALVRLAIGKSLRHHATGLPLLDELDVALLDADIHFQLGQVGHGADARGDRRLKRDRVGEVALFDVLCQDRAVGGGDDGTVFQPPFRLAFVGLVLGDLRLQGPHSLALRALH